MKADERSVFARGKSHLALEKNVMKSPKAAKAAPSTNKKTMSSASAATSPTTAATSPVMRPSKAHEATPAFQLLDSAMQSVPGLAELTAPKATKKKGKKGKAVARVAPGEVYPDVFLEGTARAIDTVPGMRDATGVDPSMIREGIAFIASYAPVADTADTMAKNVRQLVSEKRRDITTGAKTAFEWLKWRADSTKSAKLLGLVDKLQKAGGKGRKRSTKKTAAKKKTATAAQPTTVAAAPAVTQKTTEKVTETTTG